MQSPETYICCDGAAYWLDGADLATTPLYADGRSPDWAEFYYVEFDLIGPEDKARCRAIERGLRALA